MNENDYQQKDCIGSYPNAQEAAIQLNQWIENNPHKTFIDQEYNPLTTLLWITYSYPNQNSDDLGLSPPQGKEQSNLIQEEEEKQEEQHSEKRLQVQQIQIDDVDVEYASEKKQPNQVMLQTEVFLNKIPPDFDKARKHKSSQRVFDIKKAREILKDSPDNFCECCGNPVYVRDTEYSMFSGPEDLADLGIGFSLFYSYTKKLIFLLIILSLAVSLPCLFMAQKEYSQNKIFSLDHKGTNDSDNHTISSDYKMSSTNINNSTLFNRKMSMMAKFTLYGMSVTDQDEKFKEINKDSTKLQLYFIYFNLVGILIATLVSFWLKINLDNFAKELDQQNTKPSDYSLKVNYIPEDWKPEYLMEKIKEKLNVKVEYVTYCYNIHDIFAKNQEIIEYNKIKQQIEVNIRKKIKELDITRQEYDKRFPKKLEEITYCFVRKKKVDAQKINKTAKILEEELEKLQNAENKQNLFLRTAFVTLSSRDEIINVLKNHRKNKLVLRIISFCNMMICRKPKNFTAHELQSQDFDQGPRLKNEADEIQNLDFDYAPEPNDIIWENFFYEFSIKKVLNTWIACSILIGLSFIINYMLKSLTKNDSFKLTKINKQIISFVIAIIIMFINFLLKETIKKLTSKEHHRTHTAFNLSVGIKLTIARFLNSAIVPVIINNGKDKWFVDGGLVFDIFTVMIMIAIADPIYQWLDPMYRLNKRIQKYEISKLEKNECYLTQGQANTLFEGSILYMTNTLSCAGNILLTSFFFHPILPLSIPIGSVGLILLYWINKYILLRRAKRPEELSGLLAGFFANLLPWALFFWALSMTLFYKVIFEDIYKLKLEVEDTASLKIIPAYIGLGISSISILPLFFLKKFQPLDLQNNNYDRSNQQQQSAHIPTFREAVKHFRSDYQLQNPMTKREGVLRIIRNIIEDEFDPQYDQTQEEALSSKNKLIREIELQYDREDAIGKDLEWYCTMRNRERILEVDVWNREFKFRQNEFNLRIDELESKEEEKKGQSYSPVFLRNKNTIYDQIKHTSGVGFLMNKTIKKKQFKREQFQQQEKFNSPPSKKRQEFIKSNVKLIQLSDLDHQ